MYFHVCNELKSFIFVDINFIIIHLRAYSIFKFNVVHLKKNNILINFNNFLLV